MPEISSQTLSSRSGPAGLARTPGILALVVSAAVLIARSIWLWDPYLVLDDSFISYRYAVHLAYGKGLVWNLGERVEGYTNFLWTVLLAAGARWLDLPALSRVLALAAGVGTLWLLVRLGERHFAGRSSSPLLVALPPLLYAATGSEARLAVSGMETLLFVFLLLAAVALLFLPQRDRSLAAGLVFALAAMTRPEGVMYTLLAAAVLPLDPSAPFHLARARRRQRGGWRGVEGYRISRGAGRLPPESEGGPPASTDVGYHAVTGPAAGPLSRHFSRPLRFLAAFAALYVPYFVARALYYRSFLPNTYYAKAGDFWWGRLARGWSLLLTESKLWSILPVLIAALFAIPSL
ncbi:MAG TPA: hypothetical protein VIH93_03250, partial [Thermoanaerobaculia bacterium]